MKKIFSYSVVTVLLFCMLLFMGSYMAVVSLVGTITPLKTNFLYVGVDNPIRLTTNELNPKSLILKSSGISSVMKDTLGVDLYKVRINDVGTTTISVGVRSDKVFKTLFTQDFNVIALPDPVVYFGANKGDAIIASEELISTSALICRIENIDFECLFDIQSFTLSVNREGNWYDYEGQGKYLSAQMKEELLRAVSGSRIFIHDVHVKGCDGQQRILPGLSLKVR